MIDTKVDGPKDRFTGFPSAAFEFYDGLEGDNSRAYWQANKSTFESAVRGPMAALLAGLPEQYGVARRERHVHAGSARPVPIGGGGGRHRPPARASDQLPSPGADRGGVRPRRAAEDRAARLLELVPG